MDKDRYTRVKRHYLAAVELSPEKRRAYLDDLEPADRELRTEIEDLLREADSDSGLDLAAEACATPIDAGAVLASDAFSRASIGGYRIVRVIGRGGMGVVYEAEQGSPKRRVALKVIRADLAGSEAYRRFELEAEILGRLEHDGIARIFEAGVDRGPFGPEPFIAMEFVDGRPLGEYVRERALSRRDVLELVERIARAVAHAHQRGIIHRDLKPANIFVTEDGRLKILDFGISRVTEEARALTSEATEAGRILGTLGYMSPEQASGAPGDVDVRSDVYALGVMTYELLTGRLPCDLPRETLVETIEAIRTVAPKSLAHFVPGIDRDVDVIVLHALAKEKERRYESATAFADDIHRFLGHVPILARPATFAYHLRKFARRHRVLVVGVVATFLTLLAGVIATKREADLQQRARAVEAAARRAAESRAREADLDRLAAVEARKRTADALRAAENRIAESEAILDFLGRVIESARADARGPDVKVVDALAAVARRVHDDFGKTPAIEAAVRLALGRTYLSLAMKDEANRQFSAALALRRIDTPNDGSRIAEPTTRPVEPDSKK